MKRQIEKTVDDILDRAKRDGAASLPQHERLVALAWEGTARIGNGGFYKFYAEGSDIDELERIYRALGLSDCAEACLRSKDQFPGSRPPSTAEERDRLLRPRYEELEAAFWDIAQPIYAVAETFDPLLDALERYLSRGRDA